MLPKTITDLDRPFCRGARKFWQTAAAFGALGLVAGFPTASSAQAINCAAPTLPPAVVALFPNPAIAAWTAAAGCAAASSATALTAGVNSANTVFLTHTSAFVGSPPGNPDTTAGGAWIRGIGGSSDYSSTGTITTSPAIIPGALTAAGKARISFSGVQGGADIARLNLSGSGWNGHVGVTGGYMQADGTDLIGPGTGKLEVPFAGIYGVLTHTSGFYSDVLVRWDWYSISVSYPTVGLLNQPFDASGVSVTANAGYYIPLANNWFAEPSVGMVWSRTSVDPLTIPSGPITVPGIGAVVIPPGTATFDDVKSLLGRAGVRFGYNFTTPTLALQPYAVVSVWHEFADAATATLSCAACAGINLNLSSSRVGTYGQYSLGLAGQILNTGWLGYGRVDYRNGDNIEGWSVTAGLRYQWQEAGNPGVVKAKY